MTTFREPDEVKKAEAIGLTTKPALSSAGDYDVLAEIGEGGFGKVYKAKHKKLDKIVALKIIHPDLVSDATVMKRFEQEALAASSLTHANLAAVYDHGCTADGAPFLVMDYLDGDSLAQTIEREGPIPCKRALGIMIELADAMEHAHQKGILHRDLKPSNIILSSTNDFDSVKIIDFGIAKLLTVARSDANRITQTAQVLGSPAYMSPEQCLGQPIDARSDIYSLGCVMYEIIKGSAPFIGGNPVQTIVKQINEQPTVFTTKDSSSSLKRIERIIFKSLGKDPDDRYQSMAELRTDLRRVQLGRDLKVPGIQLLARISFAALVVAAVVSVICFVIDQKAELEGLARIQAARASYKQLHFENAADEVFPSGR